MEFPTDRRRERGLPDQTAAAVQVALAGGLAAGHLSSTSGYVYPHYVFLILAHPWLCRQVGVSLRPWQVGYVSVALFLHPVGGLFGYYASVWWFDHVTHTLSATLVGALAYLVARLFDEGGPTVRARLATFLAVMMAGVAWELIEEMTPLLTVYGPNDTFWDYVFDAVGGLLVAVFGERVLGGAVENLRAWRRRRAG